MEGSMSLEGHLDPRKERETGVLGSIRFRNAAKNVVLRDKTKQTLRQWRGGFLPGRGRS